MQPNRITLPLLALRGMAIFPGTMLHFDVGRKKSVLALNEAMKTDRRIFLVAQTDISEDDPAPEGLYHMGTIAEIKQILHLPNEGIRVLIEGKQRATLEEITKQEPYYVCAALPCETTLFPEGSLKAEALIRSAQQLVSEYSESGPKLPQEIVTTVLAAKKPADLADYIASNILIRLEDKQAVLEALDERRRLELTLKILGREIRIHEYENDINAKVHDEIEQNQREYYLREQFKTIAAELGDGDNPQEEALEYHERIDRLCLSGEASEKLHREADRLMKMPFGSHEATVVRTWLDTCLGLPWNKASKEKTDLAASRKILEADHYGLEKVKERILEFIAVRKLNPGIRGQIICLVGPPGVGKTSIGRSIARATGRRYARVSLGGVRDEADIRGHRKTYIGAMPGRIVNAISLAGTNNPLIVLDEVDKLCADMQGDPSSALLEVLDTEQNCAFRDHYIEIPFDLSNVMFITTANTTETIPEPLLDRMEIIPISSYTREEKFQIAKRHLLKKQIKRHGLTARTTKIKDDALYALIDGYTREAGVRGLERQIAALCRKAAKSIAEEEQKTVVISAAGLEKLLGPQKYRPEEAVAKRDEVGVVTGLAWTQVGGETMPVEVAVLEGSGKLELTGSLGDVMKESAKAAVSYIRSRARELSIDADFYKNRDIHIHVPEGAIPKDGPSAGITMATALVSALLGFPVRHSVAMTGEITLRGRVLPIGGLREKTMAAYRAGIKTVIIPEENVPDLAELETVVRDNVRFVPAESMDKVLKTALVFPEKNAEREREKDAAASRLTVVENERTVPPIRQ